MGLAKTCLRGWQIAKTSLRHNFPPHLALSAALLILTPILFGTADLDWRAAAAPLEAFVSLLGIVLLTPVFQPEQDARIEEVIASKYLGDIRVYIIRSLCSLASLLLLTGLFALYMRLNRCDVTPPLFWGTVSTAVFLGALGMLSAAVSNHTATSYMIPLGYYATNLAGGSKLGDFYLFTMTAGEPGPKLRLLILGAILMALAILAKWLLRKHR